MTSDCYNRLECIKDLIKTTRSNKYSSLRKLASEDQDVYLIWDHISQYIELYLEQRKAVHIPGLGIFTFTSIKLDVGQNKFVLIQRPIFVLSEKLIRTHRLTQSKYYVPGEIPVLKLNFTSLAFDINVERDLVEASVKEIVNTISRSIDKFGCCEFAFTTIGNLVFSKGTVKMKFLPAFLNKMDTTGGLVKYFTQRPGTSSSILPDNSLALPKIRPGEEANQHLGRIVEEEDEVHLDREKPKKTSKKDVLTPTLKVESKSPTVQHLALSADEAKPNASSSGMLSPRKQQVTNLKRMNAAVKDFKKSENDESKTTPPVVKHVFPSRRTHQSDIMKMSDRAHERKHQHQQNDDDKRCLNCIESMNDFCYLCFQREKRNVPVYFKKQRRASENADDQVLHLQAILKDNHWLSKEEDKNKIRREEAKETAAFNLNTSNELKAKNEKSKGKYQRSFIFRDRSVTPPNFLMRDDYEAGLAKQVTEKANKKSSEKKEKDILERLEQTQLAEDLVLQRDHYWKSKRLQSDNYRKALDTQMASESKPGYSDNDKSFLGICEGSNEKQLERKKRARALLQGQIVVATERKKAELLECERKRKEEEEMLKRTKAELLQETVSRNQKRLKKRQELEKAWTCQDSHKRTFEKQDKLRTRSPGILLHEQCDKYQRCNMCTRSLQNCGQSNVWSDTRFVSGSRLMV